MPYIHKQCEQRAAEQKAVEQRADEQREVLHTQLHGYMRECGYFLE